MTAQAQAESQTAAVTTPAVTETVPPTQTAAPVTEAPKVEQDTSSRQFAALAKRERALLEKERAIKEREAKYLDIEARDKARRENPDALLSDYGYTLDDLIKRKANGGKMTAEQMAQKAFEEMENLKKERADERNRTEEEKKQAELRAQQEREAAAVTDFKEKLGAFINEKKENYELVLSQEDPIELIYNIIDAHYENTKGPDGAGRIMTFEEAANHAEKYLDAEADKLLALPKIKSKVAPKETQSPEKEAPVNSRREAAKESTTLSSEIQNQSGTPKDEPVRHKDPRLMIEESKRKAAALLRWGPNT